MKKRSKSKEKNISSSSLSNVNSGSNHHDTVINLGNLGYTFRKEFDDGWFEGKVTEIRPGAKHGRDRRCLYTDGDTEDLSVPELQALALLDPQQVKKKKTTTTSSSKCAGEASSNNNNYKQVVGSSHAAEKRNERANLKVVEDNSKPLFAGGARMTGNAKHDATNSSESYDSSSLSGSSSHDSNAEDADDDDRVRCKSGRASHSSPAAIILRTLDKHPQPWHEKLVVHNNAKKKQVWQVIWEEENTLTVGVNTGLQVLEQHRPKNLLVLDDSAWSQYAVGNVLPDNLFHQKANRNINSGRNCSVLSQSEKRSRKTSSTLSSEHGATKSKRIRQEQGFAGTFLQCSSQLDATSSSFSPAEYVAPEAAKRNESTTVVQSQDTPVKSAENDVTSPNNHDDNNNSLKQMACVESPVKSETIEEEDRRHKEFDDHGEESEIEVTSKALLKHYHTMSQVPNEIIEMILTSSNRDSPSDDIISSTAKRLLDAFVSKLSESQHSFRTNLCYSNYHRHSISNGLELASLKAVNNDTRVFVIIVLAGIIEIDIQKNKGIPVKTTHEEKEAIYLRCPHDNPFTGKCGKKHQKCPYHNRTIKISSQKGEEASFIVLEYSPDPLDSFIRSANAYSIFTNHTAVKITDEFGRYKPRDNDAKGECVLISFLDHLKYLLTKDKLPKDIPVKNIIGEYKRGMTRKDAPVKSFIRGLKKYMTDKSVFDLVSKAVPWGSEVVDAVRQTRRDDKMSPEDKYAEYIKQRAELLVNIDPKNPNTWCDIFIIRCLSFWLKIPIIVVGWSGIRNLIEKQLNTAEKLAGTALSLEESRCEMRDIEPCFMYLHWGGFPLSNKPSEVWDPAHYMHLEPLGNVGSLIEWDGSIEASRVLYDLWNNVQDVPPHRLGYKVIVKLDGGEEVIALITEVLAEGCVCQYINPTTTHDVMYQIVSHNDIVLTTTENETDASLKSITSEVVVDNDVQFVEERSAESTVSDRVKDAKKNHEATELDVDAAVVDNDVQFVEERSAESTVSERVEDAKKNHEVIELDVDAAVVVNDVHFVEERSAESTVSEQVKDAEKNHEVTELDVGAAVVDNDVQFVEERSAESNVSERVEDAKKNHEVIELDVDAAAVDNDVQFVEERCAESTVSKRVEDAKKNHEVLELDVDINDGES